MKDNCTHSYAVPCISVNAQQNFVFFPKDLIARIVCWLLLLLGGLQYNLKAQTTLVAGDLVVSAFDATGSGAANDKFSFILLTNISANTEIYFTDRGYGNNVWQGANGNTEGGIKWVSGSALAAGTEVLIHSLSATVNGVSNGTVTPTTGANQAGLSLSHPSGDQIIAFQGGGGDPAGSGVTFIAGFHWNYCPIDWYSVHTTDAGWDNIGSPGSCGLSTSTSNVPPGLTGGTNAFWLGFYKPTAPAKDIQCYTKGQFNGVGVPFSSMAALRAAVLNRDNWIPVKSNDAATVNINVPTSYTFTSSVSIATITTASASSIGATSATLGGNVTADGGATVTERGIVWATTSNPTTSNNKVSNGSGTGSFSATVSVLPASTLIYVRSYAINAAGTSYGSPVSFTTAAALSATQSQNNVWCNGGSTATATVTASGGKTPYTYSWSPSGGTGATATGLAAGSYSCTITDAELTQVTKNFTITQPPAFTITTSQTNTACNGASTGSATVNVSGASGPYTYSWSPSGGTAATATGLAAGAYTVTITDANTCQTTRNFTITQPPAFTITTSQTNVACNGASTGSATVNVSGGNGAKTYSWSPSGGTAATATGLAAGAYTVTITDANLCQTTRNFTITQPPAFTITTSQTNVACNGASTGSATVNVSGASGPYTYSWSPSGGTAATATGLAAGAYTVTITDANLCQTTRNFTITQPPAFTVTTSQTNVACNGGSTGSATVNVSGASGPHTYSWSPSGGTAATATGLAAGTYTVTITDANLCQTTRNFTVTQPSAITSSISSQTNVSTPGGANGSATILASGGTGSKTYSWSPSGGTAATATGLSAGTYTVTITDANTCTKTQTVTITQPAAITSSVASQTNVACNGGNTGSATVIASGGAGGFTYSWAPSGGTAATATGLSAGVYTCTITDANEITKTQSVTITQPSALTATGSNTNVSCNGGANGTATVVASGGTPSYTYSWSPSGGTAATATGLAVGTYTCTIMDANACQTTASVTITQPVALNATASKTDVTCNGGTNGTATVSATGGTPSYTYSWSPSGGTAATATGLAPGTYTCTITDANNCQTTASVTITQPAAITVTATPSSETICSGSATGIALSAVPTGADFNWTVSTLSGNITGATSASGSSIAQVLTGGGVVKYTITPVGNSCTGSTKEVLITVNALTTVELHPSDKSIYDEETAKFAIEANNAETYQWQVDAGNGFTNIQDDAHYSGTNYYILKIVNATGAMNGHLYRCVVTGNCDPVHSNSAKLTVKVRTAQVISFASTDEKVYGSPDFVPQAGSNAGLALAFTSSDESVASIVNGKVHIKKAGQVTITASQAGNDDYKPAASVEQVLTIAKKQINVSLQASPLISKTYDGNTAATLANTNYSLVNAVEGDEVNVTGTATYNTSDAGTDKDITVDHFVLSGADKDNYTLADNSAVVKGAIERAAITVSLQASPLISKTYNGSDVATLSSANYKLTGILGEDDVTIASAKAAYSDKKAGYDKEITVTDFVLAGGQKDNYVVDNSSAVTSGDIKVKEITASLAATPAISKVYDGNDKATIPAAKYQLDGIETGDDVTVKGTAVYNNRHAGEDKAVTVNELLLQGDDAANYQLSTTELPASGSIEKATLNVTVVTGEAGITKEYDGETEAILAPDNYLVQGVIGEDHVQLNNPTKGSYDNKHGGEGKKVTVDELILMGEDAGNYTLESTTVSANIGKITRKVVGVTADAKTKVYGEADPALTYATEGVLEGDVLPGALVRTEGKNVGEYKVEQGTLEGGDDYLIEWFQNASFTITPAALTITAEDKTKKQGVANPALTVIYNGLAEGDQPTDLETQPVVTTTATASSQIGYYDIEVSGAVSSNYEITYVKGKLTITPQTDESYSVKVWSPNPNQLQIKIYTERAQKAAIILYTETGQQVILQQQQLAVGVNSFTMSVSHLASSTYILGVKAEQFKDSQKVRVK